MSYVPHVSRVPERSVYRCDFCHGEASYAEISDAGDFARFRRGFIDAHRDCPAPQATPTHPPNEKEISMAKERKVPSCSRCGETGHNALTCSRRDGAKPAAPARKKPRRRGPQSPRTSDSPPQPDAEGVSRFEAATIHLTKSIISVTHESGATVIRIRER